MATPQIKRDTPTLWNVWFHTWRNEITSNRWNYMDRDIVPSKIKITKTLVYNKERPTLPDEKLEIRSFSYPQYPPYIKIKGKKSNKQRKIRHQYDIILILQKDSSGEYSFNSKIRWHVGSFKMWKKPNQSQIKSVYRDTRKNLDRRFGKNTQRYKDEIKKIKKRGRYLDAGDYNSQVNGLNGDFYWTGNPLCYLQNCSFGMVWNKEPQKTTTLKKNNVMSKINYPFFGKHELAILLFLFKKGYIRRG